MNPSPSSLSPSSFSAFSERKKKSSSSDERNHRRLKNDVFMNFCYEEIGKGFISHLQGAVKGHGFTILDHTLLPKGLNVCLELSKAVKESRIYVLVFSTNYAFSERCLSELVEIMDCFRRSKERKVLPVFYKVEPSDVKKQRDSFKEAFEGHETKFDLDRVWKWRQALEEAGGLSGCHLKNEDEAKFVRKVVKELETMQNPQELHVTDHPVGIQPRVNELISVLELELNNVSIVAVLGIWGIGKTTIVKATYNKIAANFDAHCFLEVNRQHYDKSSNWKVSLQNELISCLSPNGMSRIKHCHNDGVTTIRKLICCRKVLMVLDNVGKYEQLQALGIRPECFYAGSRIIVTTRDRHSLGILPYSPYNIRSLNIKESLQLFTLHIDAPVDEKFVKQVVKYAAGIPLVLEHWSCQFKHQERKQWPGVLNTLKRIPHGDVQKLLQVGYNSLPKRDEKLFLDITHFFDEMEKDLVVNVLQEEDLPFFPDKEIQYLVNRGLVNIGFGSRVSMNRAIREMGHEIVRLENQDKPGQHTRLRDPSDVVRVLTERSGTESVQSIRLDYHDKEHGITVEAESLRGMSNLELIKLSCYRLSWTCSNDDMPSFSFQMLKYMEWYGYPFRSINIDMSNVVVLRLRHSKLEILWEGIKSLKKLRILDVNDSSSLTNTGDFYGLENLEELYLAHCRNLEEVHNSVGCLHKLAILDLRGCTNLKMFPWEMIGKLQCLQELKLTDCPNIIVLGFPLLGINNGSKKGIFVQRKICKVSSLNRLEKKKRIYHREIRRAAENKVKEGSSLVSKKVFF